MTGAVYCHGNRGPDRVPAVASVPRSPRAIFPSGLVSLLRLAVEMMRSVFGEHLSFSIQTLAERGRPARGVTLRLIEQRTLRFNDSSTSRAGTVHLLKSCNEA